MSRLNEVLERVGLPPEESAVYLATLEAGTRPASIIAKKAKLKTGQTYNILQRLIERGLIQEIEKGGVKHFIASSPNRLVSMLESKADHLKTTREKLVQFLPEFMTLQAPRLHHSKVRFFHGRYGITQVLEDAIRTGDKLILGVLDIDAQGIEDREIERLHADARAKRMKHECWYYALISGTAPFPEFMSTDYERLRIIRRIPDLKLPVQFLIYGPKLSIYTYLDPQFALTIDDPAVAESARNMFFKIWDGLADYHREA